MPVAQGKFDVLQACNPPDIFWPIARWLRRRDGSRFVFDHHDLCPELYDSRFPDGSALPRRGLLALERATFRTADHVVATNASYAEIAMRRGGKAAADVTVVRTGPDQERLQRKAAVPALRRGRQHLVAYIGVMGPQDGVDLAVRAAAHVVHDLGREDVAFTFMGAGDSYDDLVALRDELGLQDYVELPGRVPDDTVLDVLSTAAVGLSPDPKNPLNDVSTMNKTLEYMAFGLPVVAFDLKETRVSAGDAAVYIQSGDVAAYARAIVELLDDDDKRAEMGKGRTPSDRGRAGLAVPARCLRRCLRRARRPSIGCEADMCGVAGAFLPAGRSPAGADDGRSHRPSRAGCSWACRSVAARTGSARAPAAVDHRPVNRGGSAVRQGRPALELQRRAVQLPRAAQHPARARASGSRRSRTPRLSWSAGGTGGPTPCRGSAGCSRSRSTTSAAAALTLVRDPLGIKPMYVMPRGSGILFASELKALVTAVGPGAHRRSGCPRRIDAVLFPARGAVRRQGGLQAPTGIVGRVARRRHDAGPDGTGSPPRKRWPPLTARPPT